MEPPLAIGSSQSSGSLNWIVGAIVAGVVVVGGWMALDTIINGPQVWEVLEHQNAAEIEQEDRTFCSTFGMGPESEAFESCARELAQIRQLQSARTERKLRYF